jgi:hypothetical protein
MTTVSLEAGHMNAKRGRFVAIGAVALAIGAISAMSCTAQLEGEEDSTADEALSERSTYLSEDEELEGSADCAPVNDEEAQETLAAPSCCNQPLGCPVCGSTKEDQYTQCVSTCLDNGGTVPGCKSTCCRRMTGCSLCYIC